MGASTIVSQIYSLASTFLALANSALPSVEIASMYAVKSSSKAPWLGAILFLALLWTLFSLHSVHSMRLITDELLDSSSQTVDTVGSTITTSETASLRTPEKDATVTRTPLSVPSPTVSSKPLVLYAYSESASAHINLKFFLAHGLHDAADFIFILNGPTDASAIIPSRPNIRVVNRSNDCYDLGAYAEVLLTASLYKAYSRFIMLNASIRGPFMPYWTEACWSDRFLNKLTDQVKLVGMTGNCWPTFHIQSMILATDSIGMQTLLFPPIEYARELEALPAYGPIPNTADDFPPPYPGINACFHKWASAVSAEIGSSMLIKAAGYSLDVMMSAYHAQPDYEGECDSKENGDVLEDKGYFGTNVHPYETIFIKTNRDIDPISLSRLTEWADGRGYSSYDYCSI